MKFSFLLLIIILLLSSCKPEPISVDFVNQNVFINKISNQILHKNETVSFDFGKNSSTFRCYFDNSINHYVTPTQTCSSISGFYFNKETGQLTWTPTEVQAGNYEFKIELEDGVFTDSQIFSIKTDYINRSPSLDPLIDQVVVEGEAVVLTAFDGGDNFDIDKDNLTYSCVYDGNIDFLS